MCVHNDKGNFVAVFTKQLKGKSDVQEAEATGLLETLKWLQDLHLTPVQIETCCLQMVQSFRLQSYVRRFPLLLLIMRLVLLVYTS